MSRFSPLIVMLALCALVIGLPPTAGSDPGGTPVCNGGAPGALPGVADCPQPGDPQCGSDVQRFDARCVSNVLPYCSVPYMLLPDTAAVGGKSWQCLANGVDPTLDDPLLPYCAAPLELVPDLASLGGQRWKCPASAQSGYVGSAPPFRPLPSGSDVLPSTMAPAPPG
jgi:hypothetical protein